MSERVAKFLDNTALSVFLVLLAIKIWIIGSISWWWVFSPLMVLYVVALSWYYIEMYKLKRK